MDCQNATYYKHIYGSIPNGHLEYYHYDYFCQFGFCGMLNILSLNSLRISALCDTKFVLSALTCNISKKNNALIISYTLRLV